MSKVEHSADFQRGWQAALQAAQHWHEAQAAQAMIQARRSRFPKNHERDAQLHKTSAEALTLISPDDV